MPSPRRSWATSGTRRGARFRLLRPARSFCDRRDKHDRRPVRLPHSRTCNCKSATTPPVSVFVRPVACSATVRLAPPRLAVRLRSSPLSGSSTSGRAPYLSPPGCLSAGSGMLTGAFSPSQPRDTRRVEAHAKTAFVGRAAELAKLAHALEAAQAGSGATVPRGRRGGYRRAPARVPSLPRARRGRRCLARTIDRSCRHELPYQPFAEALRRSAAPADGQAAGLPAARL